MVYVLFNQKSGNGRNGVYFNAEKFFPEKEIKKVNVRDAVPYRDFFNNLEADDEVVLLGGDGTINYMINDLGDYEIKNKLYLVKWGTGNDFLNDVYSCKIPDDTIVELNPYLENLPIATINGKSYKFLNNVAFGLDGEVCSIGEELMANGATSVNYTSVAIKLLLKYKVTNAHITVDGKSYDLPKAWLAPTMNGRYYGGGMMMTPDQDRNSDEVSVACFYNSGRLKTLMIFPKIFEGGHVAYKDNIKIIKGKEITVSFDEPKDVHIDGEVIRNVKEYTVTKKVKVKA